MHILPNAAMLGYLPWFMNLSLNRSRINNYSRDRTSRVIALALLSGLEVVVPAINRQEKILQIAQLDLQVRALEARVAEMRWFETETSLFQYAQGVLHQPRCCAEMLEWWNRPVVAHKIDNNQIICSKNDALGQNLGCLLKLFCCFFSDCAQVGKFFGEISTNVTVHSPQATPKKNLPLNASNKISFKSKNIP
jgi:hypothetical protein